jgi:hypothetical protein
MIIKLKAKGNKLELDLQIHGGNPITNSVFTNPGYALSKRLEAVAVGLRSELLMFLLEVEKETEIK